MELKTNAFMLILAGALVLGGGLGGAFAGGLALGKSLGAATAPTASPMQSRVGSGQQAQGQLSPQERLQQFRQQLQAGELTQEQIDKFRQPFQGKVAQGGTQGLAGRGGLTGTVEKIEGNTVTINTPQGPLLATVGSDTTIRMTAVGTLQDLKTGLRVTVTGQRGVDGTVTATAIIIAPEGADFGGGLFPGGRQPPP